MDILSWKNAECMHLWTRNWPLKKFLEKKWFLRVVCPVSSFNISQNDISALEHAYAPKNRLYASFLTLNKMIIKFFQFSKFSNNLGIRSESSQCRKIDSNGSFYDLIEIVDQAAINLSRRLQFSLVLFNSKTPVGCYWVFRL